MKWIEWVPEMAHGVYQQLLNEAGKHSSAIWIVEPPPYGRVSCAPINMEAVQHYVDQGGVPVGWIDENGFIHTFKLRSPFEPPDFKISVVGLGGINYEYFSLTKQFLGEVYDELCRQNVGLRKRAGGDV